MNEIFDKYYEDAKELVMEIYSTNCCPSCAGTYLNFSCKYCGHFNPKLDELITKLNKILDNIEKELMRYEIKELPDNKLFNMLMLISNRDLPLLDMLIDKYDYKENFIRQYNRSISKINDNEELTEIEIRALESYIYINNKNIDLRDVYNYFIKNAMLNRQKVDYECFKVLIKQFTELLMQQAYKNASCTIKNIEKENAVGGALFTKVELAESDVLDFYNGKNAFLLFTIAHEVRHTNQYKSIFNDLLLTPFIIDEIKEFVLHDYNKEYYNQNYDDISFEKEAELFGIADALEYIHALGVRLPSDIEEKYFEFMENLKTKLFKKERVFNGEETTLDCEFEKVIVDHPEALNKYKQLCFLYKIVDNKVVKKSDAELMIDLENIMQNDSVSLDDKNYYKEFYSYYLGTTRI